MQAGGLAYGDVYGRGERGVVSARSGCFDKERCEKQARTLAIDLRGFLLNAPLHFDVLGAVRYLRKTGVTGVSVVGGDRSGVVGVWLVLHAGREVEAA